MIARVLEEAGLTMTSLSMVREHTERVKPPRALFVPYPFGRPLGRPGDPALQLRVLRAALALTEAPRGPVLEDFADHTFADDVNLPQAATVSACAECGLVSAEVDALRPDYERWVAAHSGRTAVGVAGVAPARLPALAACLQAYADGAEADLPERPSTVELPQFLRWCADDLKAYYFEARLNQVPDSPFQDLHRWFWGQTAAGALCVAVRDRLKAGGDPKLDAAAFGIAR